MSIQKWAETQKNRKYTQKHQWKKNKQTNNEYANSFTTTTCILYGIQERKKFSSSASFSHFTSSFIRNASSFICFVLINYFFCTANFPFPYILLCFCVEKCAFSTENDLKRVYWMACSPILCLQRQFRKNIV